MPRPEGRISPPEASGGSFRSLLFREGPFRHSGSHSGSVDTLSRYGDSELIPVPSRPSPSRDRTFWLCYLRSRDLTRGGGEPLGWGKSGVKVGSCGSRARLGKLGGAMKVFRGLLGKR